MEGIEAVGIPIGVTRKTSEMGIIPYLETKKCSVKQ